MTYGRTYGEQHFSPLNQVNDQNVSQLGLAWFYDLDTNRGQEATPIVVDGVMYFTSAWSKVFALDAASGKLLWSYDPKVPGSWAVNACCDVVNRGVAAWDGKIFVGTLDGRLIALDAKTGRLVWEMLTIDPSFRYTITGAPRVAKGKVIIGNGGGEFGVRGYVSAYDSDTGKLVWRFYTVPGDPAKPFESPILKKLSKPGVVSGGSSAAAARYGTRWPMIPNSISSISARATALPGAKNFVARKAATICSPAQLLRSTWRQASTSGIIRKTPPTPGTSTPPKISFSPISSSTGALAKF